MNAKMSVLVICVEAIMYLLLYNLHDCTFQQFFISIKILHYYHHKIIIM